MAERSSNRQLFDTVLRIIEVGLICVTAIIMHRGYKLQTEANSVQIRPYVSLVPDADYLVKLDKTNANYEFKLKNQSSFPARKVKTYGLVVVDGEPIHGIDCYIAPDAKETRELFASKYSCDLSLPDVTVNMKSFRVCVMKGNPGINMQPHDNVTWKTSFQRKFFDMLVDAKESEDSGVSLVTVYGDMNGQNLYHAVYGILPYKSSLTTYEHKVF
jgi:phage tail tube protein FII